MKTALFSFVTLALVAGMVWWFGIREPEATKPPSDPASLIGKTTQRPGAGLGGGSGFKPPKLPGMGGVTPPGIGSRMSEEVFAEFAEEMEFSAAETKEFLDALKESSDSMVDVMQVDSGTGLPKLPSPEEITSHFEERERLLTGVLGSDGYEKYKAFTATMMVRGVINDQFGKGGGGVLGAEEKKDVLYGAYEDLRSGTPPSSPHQFGEMLTAAVLKRSSKHLSEEDQGKLQAGLKKHFNDELQMLGPPGGMPNLPNLPAIPGGGGGGALPPGLQIPGGAP